MSKQVLINLSDEDFNEIKKQFEEMKSSKVLVKDIDFTSVETFLAGIIKNTIKTNKHLNSDFFSKVNVSDLLEKIKDLSNLSDLKNFFDLFDKKEANNNQKNEKSDEEKYKS